VNFTDIFHVMYSKGPSKYNSEYVKPHYCLSTCNVYLKCSQLKLHSYSEVT